MNRMGRYHLSRARRSTEAAPQRVGRRRLRGEPAWWLLPLGALLLSLSACGAVTSSAPSPNTHATATAGAAATGTAAAQATRAATPVLLTVQAHQEGSITGKDLRLVITISATNQTTATIHLALNGCWDYVPKPTEGTIVPFILRLHDATGQVIWASGTPGGPCSREAPAYFDLQEAAAGATYTTTATYQLSGAHDTDLRPLLLQAGPPYTLEAGLRRWHQGALDKSGYPPPGVPQGTADAQIPITFR